MHGKISFNIRGVFPEPKPHGRSEGNFALLRHFKTQNFKSIGGGTPEFINGCNFIHNRDAINAQGVQIEIFVQTLATQEKNLPILSWTSSVGLLRLDE